MDGWEIVTLDSIVDVTMGQSPKSEFYNENGEGLPFLQGNKTFGDKYPSFEMYTSSVTKKALKNDVLMSVRAPVGDLNIAPEDICIGRGVCSLKMKKGDNEFLYYLLKANISKLLNRESGTVFGSVNKKDIETLEVAIPKDLKVQDKILTILKNIDEKILTNKQLNQNLESLAENVFKNWFVDCAPFKSKDFKETKWGLVPKNWKEIEFGDLIYVTTGKRPNIKSVNKTEEFKYPIYGASSIMGYVDEYLFDEDIFIIGRVGTHGIVQRVNCKSFPSDNTLVIKSNYYNFIYQILKRIDYDSLNIGSTQPLLTQKSIKKVEIILPFEDILRKYESFCEKLFNKIDKNNEEIVYLTNLRDTLLPKLMSGEIDVSDVLKFN